MPILTAIVLAAFVGYGAAWYTGAIEGNFALLLFMATLVTGLYWLAERFVFLPRRRAAIHRVFVGQPQQTPLSSNLSERLGVLCHGRETFFAWLKIG